MGLRTLVRDGKEVKVVPGSWDERRKLARGWQVAQPKPVEPEPAVEPASQEEADGYEPESSEE